MCENWPFILVLFYLFFSKIPGSLMICILKLSNTSGEGPCQVMCRNERLFILSTGKITPGLLCLLLDSPTKKRAVTTHLGDLWEISSMSINT